MYFVQLTNIKAIQNTLYSLKFKEVWKSPAVMTSGAIIVRKHSPYTKFLKQAIMSIIENGQLNAYFTRHSKTEQECKTRRTKGDSLGMSKLATSFLILFFGYLLSFLILLYEHFFCSKIKENPSFGMLEKNKLKIKIEAINVLIPQITDKSLKMKTEALIMKTEERCLLLLQSKVNLE